MKCGTCTLQAVSYTHLNLEDFGADTDWLGELTRTAVSHSHNLSLRGGSKNTNYTDWLLLKGSGLQFLYLLLLVVHPNTHDRELLFEQD